MSIDDPISAAEAALASEKRESSVVAEYVALVAPFVPDPIAKALSELLKRDSAEKLRYMADVVKEEVLRLRAQLERLIAENEDRRRFAQDAWPALAIDAFRKAEQTRTTERVRRIACILTSSLVVNPVPAADTVEEMMRVAMDLTDREIYLLKEIVRTQRFLLSQEGRVAHKDAYDRWADLRLAGFTDGEIDSIGSKLQSFGLVGRIPAANSINILANAPNRYSLLHKGVEFIKFVDPAGD